MGGVLGYLFSPLRGVDKDEQHSKYYLLTDRFDKSCGEGQDNIKTKERVRDSYPYKDRFNKDQGHQEWCSM